MFFQYFQFIRECGAWKRFAKDAELFAEWTNFNGMQKSRHKLITEFVSAKL